MTSQPHAATEPETPSPSMPTSAPKEVSATKPTATNSQAKKVASKKRIVKKRAAKAVEVKRATKKSASKKPAAKKRPPEPIVAKKANAKKSTAKRPRRKERNSKKLPPKPTTNKAQAIRDAAKKIGKSVRGRDVIAALEVKGITVTSAQVSNTLHAAGFRRAKRRKTPSEAAPTTASSNRYRTNTFEVSDLVQTKKIAEQLGGIGRLKEVLTALERLT
jgi:hypothetical protein